MRTPTVLFIISLAVFAIDAQTEKESLRRELKQINERVLKAVSEPTKSKANFIDRESGEVQQQAIQFEQGVSGFSGCILSLYRNSVNRRERYESNAKVSIPLKHVDASKTFASVNDGVLRLDFATAEKKIRVSQFSSGKSMITGSDGQRSGVYATGRYTIFLQVSGDTNAFVQDILRAINICNDLSD